MQMQDKPLIQNHQLGKIAYHTVPTRNAVLRLKIAADGSLETMGRALGGAWGEATPTVHPNFLAAMRDYLVSREAIGYFYIEESNLKIVNKRFTNLRQPKVAQ